jgi:uncharacterized protein YeeX (DUF496 family)
MNKKEIKDFLKKLSDDEKREILGEILTYYVKTDNDITEYVGYPLKHFDWEVLYDNLLVFRKYK